MKIVEYIDVMFEWIERVWTVCGRPVREIGSLLISVIILSVFLFLLADQTGWRETDLGERIFWVVLIGGYAIFVLVALFSIAVKLWLKYELRLLGVPLVDTRAVKQEQHRPMQLRWNAIQGRWEEV